MNTNKIAKAKEVAHILYEGKLVPHYSCGIALAETFCLPSKPYQSLRRGGLTGEGVCGAFLAGQIVLGEILGDPDPTAPITKKLFDGMDLFKRLYKEKIKQNESKDFICKEMISKFDFDSDERKHCCLNIVVVVAECIAIVLEEMGVSYSVKELNL